MHGKIQRVAVGQELIIERAAEALVHQRKGVVAEVHQVRVVPPEIRQIQGHRALSRQQQRIVLIGVFAALQVRHRLAGIGKVFRLCSALAALALRQTIIIALQQPDHRVQRRGALNDARGCIIDHVRAVVRRHRVRRITVILP